MTPVKHISEISTTQALSPKDPKDQRPCSPNPARGGGFSTSGRFSYSAISSFSWSLLQGLPGAQYGAGPPSPACSRNWSLLQGLPGAQYGAGPPSPACSHNWSCLLYTSDAADEEDSVD